MSSEFRSYQQILYPFREVRQVGIAVDQATKCPTMGLVTPGKVLIKGPRRSLW